MGKSEQIGNMIRLMNSMATEKRYFAKCDSVSKDDSGIVYKMTLKWTERNSSGSDNQVFGRASFVSNSKFMKPKHMYIIDDSSIKQLGRSREDSLGLEGLDLTGIDEGSFEECDSFVTKQMLNTFKSFGR